MKSTGILSVTKTLTVRGKLIDLSSPKTMGVLNITPDSFYEESRVETGSEILKQAESMLADGATFLDIGGYSSRPGAADIPVEEEMNRVVRAIRLVVKEFPEAIISVDTFRSKVAAAAVDEGAAMVNDISGGELDPEMIENVAKWNVPFVLMHMRGDPGNMNTLNQYEDMMKEIIDYFHVRLHKLREAGIKDVIIDPGFGFAKNREQNFELLNHLDALMVTGKPILAGLSRKSLIWKTLGIQPDEAMNGTTALNTIALVKGASILRVHDVKEAMEVIKLVDQLHPQ